MPERSQLLRRLDEIARSLEADPRARALIGLGSCGAALHRLDDFSDLDFFAVVEGASKAGMTKDLGWLERVAPVAYAFRNTGDGYKLLYEDGVFCEFAVFTESELHAATYADARVVWARPDFDLPSPPDIPATEPPVGNEVDWCVGEALTNLYVGMGRFVRGEKQSACRFVQGYAVDRITELAMLAAREATHADGRDPFSPERRIEHYLPELSSDLAAFQPGYLQTPAAAEAILGYLEDLYEVNGAIAVEIRRLVGKAGVP